MMELSPTGAYLFHSQTQLDVRKKGKTTREGEITLSIKGKTFRFNLTNFVLPEAQKIVRKITIHKKTIVFDNNGYSAYCLNRITKKFEQILSKENSSDLLLEFLPSGRLLMGGIKQHLSLWEFDGLKPKEFFALHVQKNIGHLIYAKQQESNRIAFTGAASEDIYLFGEDEIILSSTLSDPYEPKKFRNCLGICLNETHLAAIYIEQETTQKKFYINFFDLKVQSKVKTHFSTIRLSNIAAGPHCLAVANYCGKVELIPTPLLEPITEVNLSWGKDPNAYIGMMHFQFYGEYLFTVALNKIFQINTQTNEIKGIECENPISDIRVTEKLIVIHTSSKTEDSVELRDRISGEALAKKSFKLEISSLSIAEISEKEICLVMGSRKGLEIWTFTQL